MGLLADTLEAFKVYFSKNNIEIDIACKWQSNTTRRRGAMLAFGQDWRVGWCPSFAIFFTLRHAKRFDFSANLTWDTRRVRLRSRFILLYLHKGEIHLQDTVLVLFVRATSVGSLRFNLIQWRFLTRYIDRQSYPCSRRTLLLYNWHIYDWFLLLICC